MRKINLIFILVLIAVCAGCVGAQEKSGNPDVRVSGDMTISAGTSHSL